MDADLETARSELAKTQDALAAAEVGVDSGDCCIRWASWLPCSLAYVPPTSTHSIPTRPNPTPRQARLPEIEELQKQLTDTQQEATEAGFRATEEAAAAAAREKALAGG